MSTVDRETPVQHKFGIPLFGHFTCFGGLKPSYEILKGGPSMGRGWNLTSTYGIVAQVRCGTKLCLEEGSCGIYGCFDRQRTKP